MLNFIRFTPFRLRNQHLKCFKIPNLPLKSLHKRKDLSMKLSISFSFMHWLPLILFFTLRLILDATPTESRILKKPRLLQDKIFRFFPLELVDSRNLRLHR